MLAEIRAYLAAARPERQPGDVTITDVAADRGITPDAARRVLAQATRAGVLVDAGKVLDPAIGRWVRVWRLP